MQRRDFLRWAAASAPLTLNATRLWSAPQAMPARFLLVFLRGGYDAANLLVPHGSPLYYESRPNIAIARPGTSANAALPVDAQWGLAPALTDRIFPLFQRGQVAFVPFAGTDDTSRSHFETQDRIELGHGAQGVRDYGSGFMNRLAAAVGGTDADKLSALSFTDQLPLVFRGSEAIANQSLRDIGKSGVSDKQAQLIASMYANTKLAGAVSDGFEVRKEITREMASEEKAANRNAITTRGFATEARRIARLMRERVHLGFVDVGGWDTHVGEGGATGTLANRLGELGQGLSVFAEEMGPLWDSTVVVVLSEFGRTFRENGNRGTDHGHGSVYWVMGGSVRGGCVAGEQQAISTGTLFQNRDYPVLNEYRAVLGGLFTRMYGLDGKRVGQVFPGTMPKDIGLI
ncbi:MAG: DUF1501 domain-containing protein [Burkholderiales bacterium]|nr:DUF1501 domain-containing protein [Burkholderiales bacterium]